MASRIFEVAFRISGQLSSEFANAMRAAQSQLQNLSRQARISARFQGQGLQQLQGYLGNLHKQIAQIEKFKGLTRTINENSAALTRARLKSAQLTREYQDQQKQTQSMRQSLQRLQDVYRNEKGSMSTDQRGAMREQIRQAQQELREQVQRERTAGTNLTSHNTGMDRLQSQLRSQQSALAQLRSSMSQSGVNVGELASQESRLRAEIERTTQAIERQAQRRATFDRHNAASQNLFNAYGNFQGAMDTASTIMSPFKAAVNEAVTFEQSMSKLKALTQVRNLRAGNIAQVNAEMSAMSDEIKHLGDTTEFTRTEVAQAAQKYAMSGWNYEQIKAVLQPTIDVTSATGERDVVKIADMLSDEMQALGMKAGQQVKIAGKTYEAAKHWGDVFAYATNQSNVDATAFHESLKYNAPVGHAAGMSAHEIAAINMVMANSAIKGSMSGTAMRTGILRVLAPPKQAAKGLQDLDSTLSMSDAQKQIAEAQGELSRLGIKETENWTQKLLKMSQAFQAMDKNARLTSMEKIFGKNAVSGWAAFFDTNSIETFQNYLKDMDSGVVDNWVQDTAGVMRDNTATQFKLFESAMAGAANSVGTVFLPVIRLATEGITSFTSSFGAWAENNQTAVAALGYLAAGISAVIVLATGAALAFSAWTFVTTGIAALGTAITGVIAAIKAAIVGFNLAALFSPIGIAVAALALAAYYVYNNWSTVAPIFESLASTITGALGGAVETISAAFSNLGVAASNLGPLFSNLGGVIFAGLATVLNVAVNIGATLISTFANAVATIISVFGNLGQAIAAIFAGDFSKAGEHLKNALVSAVEGAINTIKALLGGVFDTVTSIFDPVKMMLGRPTGDGASGGGSFGKAEVTQKVEHEVKVAMDTSQLASTFQNAFQITQQKNPQADLSQLAQTISSSIQTLKDKPDTNPDQIAATVAQAIQTTQQQNPEVDLTAIVDAARAAFQPAQENIQQTTLSIAQAGEAFAQLPATVQPLTDTFTQLPAAVQPTVDGMNQFNSGMMSANGELMNAQGTLTANNSALSASTSALSTFNGALSSTNGGLSSLASSSSSAAGAISGLGSAASSAVSALQSAGANAAAAVSAAASAASAKPAANAQGGIYNKGAFLTWFAEKSPEAAIPLDGSNRAISLWRKVGQMLGIFPKTDATFDKPSTSETVSARQPKFDELGNIIGLHGLKDNLISKDDDIQGTNAKKSAQLAEWKKKFPAEKKILPQKNSGGGDFLKKYFPNFGNIGFNPHGNVSPKILPAVEENFSEAVKQSKSYQTLQAARERLKNTTESDSIFGKAPEVGNIFNGGLKLPDLPQQIGQLENLKAGTEGIFPQLINNLTSSGGNNFDSASPIDLKFEINIQGNANAEDIQNGIQMSIPMIEDALERRLDEVAHEKQRRSFS